MAICLIGLGSNLGDRRKTLDWACRQLDEAPRTKLIARSRWHETVPVGGPRGQGPFLNGALVLETPLAPEALFERLKEIESRVGRRREVRWGPRALDLDLLLYDQLAARTPRLEVPHPRMAWRRFVLEPAAEIAAEMIHPTTGWTIGQLWAHLNATRPYVAVAGPIGVGKTHLAGLFASRLGAEPLHERFDSARLEAFYADPAGSAWDMELEFLSQRVELLAADAPRWSQPDRFWVSDFWFDQSLAYAAVWLPPDKVDPFGARWQQARSRVEPPKLTVLLDAATETLLERIGRRGRRAEQGLGAAQLDRIRQAILALAGEPGHGPILRLVADDAQRVFEEAAAAIEATGLKVQRAAGDATP